MLTRLTLAAVTAVLLTGTGEAYEMLERRICTLETPTRPAVHTECVISGGMQDGSVDASIKTPDGKAYPLVGSLEAKASDPLFLAGKRAKVSGENCYTRLDGTLGICLLEKIP